MIKINWRYCVLFLLLLRYSFVKGQVAVQDSLALVAFYQSTNGSEWTSHNGWLEEPVTFWEGIGVIGGRVNVIELIDHHLTGVLPGEWCDLTSLERVNLQNNQLSGNLPLCSSIFSNLNILNLSYNELSDTSLEQFFSKTPNLQFLNLSHNRLIKFPKLKFNPGLSINLKYLAIDYNRLTFKDIIPNLDSTKSILYTFSYYNQDKVGEATTLSIDEQSGFSFSLILKDTGNVYQWYKDAVALSNGERFSGVDTPNLVNHSSLMEDAGIYTCRVTNPNMPPEASPEFFLISHEYNVTIQKAPVVYEFLSPNGDGKNEVFYVKDIESYPPMDVSIYNAFHQLVYSNTSYDNSWEGGNLPVGQYYYVLRINSQNAVYRGSVHIKR